MKLKVYNLAAMALVCLATVGTKSYAQQSSAPSSPSTPTAAQAPASAYSFSTGPAMVYVTPPAFNMSLAPLATLSSNYMGLDMIQDSAYRKKMLKLQEQMRDLQKEMSSLRTEEYKKASAERTKMYAERTKVYAESFKNFDKSFYTGQFNKAMGSLRFNFDKTEDLDKKVASGDYKLKSKSYTKSYNVDANDKLQIENRYGKVTVNTWNKNEVKVDVEIRAYANEDDDAQKLLDQIKITDSKDNNNVSFVTNIGDENHKNNFWGTLTSNGKTTVRKAIVNYVVYMPAKSALTISNSFGAIVLPELSGKLNIKNSYGSLTTKSLSNPENVISVRFCDANIESLNGSDLKVDYGSLNLQWADKLTAEISHSPAKIGTISTSGTINLHYGDGLQINNLAKNLKTLSVNSQFAPVKLTSLANDNADFDVSVHYGGFTYNNGVSVTSKSPEDSKDWSSTQTYKGRIGKGNGDKVITIKSNYSSVKFDQ
jgi:hypothetical protein